jgi:cell volume regulation protein A
MMSAMQFAVAMEVAYLFAGVGIVILIGFMGTLLFQRTKIPDILVLIGMGLLIGPILTEFTDFGLLDDMQMEGALATVAPYFAALALIIILFDGGLNLRLDKTLGKMNVAVAHTAMAFVGSVLVTGLACWYFFAMDLRVAVLLGCIIGGVGSAVAIPLLQRSAAKEETKILLTLEAVMTDVLCIVTALIMIEILEGMNLGPGVLVGRLLGSFVIAGFLAFVFGVFWLMVLRELEGKPFAFMITIAALLVLYAAAEFIQVSGAIAALVFGLVLGNKEEIARMLRLRGRFVLDEHIREFHSEVSFLIRTFFFVYLGVTFTFSLTGASLGSLPWYVPDWMAAQPMLVLGLFLAILFACFVIVRAVTTAFTCHAQKESAPDRWYITTMLSKDLATAVLAQLPFTIAAFAAPTAYYLLLQPYQNLFLNIVFMSIVVSVVLTSVGAYMIERRGAQAPAQPARPLDWAAKSPSYRKVVMEKGGEPEQKPTAQGPKPWNGPPAQAQIKPATNPMQTRQAQPAAGKGTPPQRQNRDRAEPPPAQRVAATARATTKKAQQGQHPIARRAAEAEDKQRPARKKPEK